MPLQEQRGLKAGNREQIIRRLDEGRDDLYVFRHPPDNNEIEIIDFLPNPLVAIAPEGHPLTRLKNLDLADLAKHPYCPPIPSLSGGRAGLAELKVKNLPIDSHWFLLRPRSKRQSLIADTFLHYLQTDGQESVLAELKAELGSQ